MKNSEVIKRQEVLLKEVFFLKEKHTQNERKELEIESYKNKS